MTNKTLKEAAALRNLADRERRKAAELLDTHGHGVRPGWVSAELSIAWDSADAAEHKADLLQLHGSETVDQLVTTARMIKAADRHTGLIEEVYQSRLEELETRKANT